MTIAGIGARLGMVHGRRQGSNVVRVEFNESATLQTAWQHHGAIADPDQTAHGMADGLEHAANFPVSAFGNGDAVPTVGALAPASLDGAELRHAVVQRHPFQQTLFLFVVQGAENAYSVFPFESKAWVHEPVGQLARAGQKQKTFGVQVKTPHGLPFTLKQPWQTAKNRGPVLRVIVRDDLAGRLVISNDTRGRHVNAHTNRLAVDFDGIAKLDALTDVRGLGIDGNTPFQDELLHLQARTQAGLGQNLVQLW